MTGFLFLLIHVLMSFLLFHPAVYGKFFMPDGTLTLNAGLSMLGGVAAFVVLWGYNMSFQTFLREDAAFIQFITSRRFMLFALLLGAGHSFFYVLQRLAAAGGLAWRFTADQHDRLRLFHRGLCD